MKLKKFEISDEPPFDNVRIVHVFFADVQPVFFLVSDEQKRLYVVSLCDERKEVRWIVSPVIRSDVRRMLLDKITPRELFEISRKLGSSFVIIKKNNKTEVKCVSFDEIDKLDLPTENMYFEAEVEELLSYGKSMEYFDKRDKKFTVSEKYVAWLKDVRTRFCEGKKRDAYSYA